MYDRGPAATASGRGFDPVPTYSGRPERSATVSPQHPKQSSPPHKPDRHRPDQTHSEKPSEADVPILDHPADGLPEVVADLSALRTAVSALSHGDGPVAIDAERAHGFRYSQRAYLIQLRRHGSGTILIDPIALAPSATVSASAPDKTPPTKTAPASEPQDGP